MAQNVALNNDEVITIGDINAYDVGQDIWFTFMNAKSTALSLKEWKSYVADKPTVTIYENITQEIYEDVKNGTATEETLNHLDNDGYWLLGDYVNGGLVIFNRPSSNRVAYLLVKKLDDTGDNFNNWFYDGVLDQDIYDPYYGDLYVAFFDIYKRNGTFNTGYSCRYTGSALTGKWSISDNQVIYTRYPMPQGFGVTSIESDDFVNNLLIFYRTTFICTDNGGRISENNNYYPWWAVGSQPKPDPNDGGGGSSTGGGDGSFDNTSDVIPIPELPPDLLLSSGIIKMYYPTPAQMSAFTNFIYSSPLDVVANFKKIWANPMDSIISLGTVPFNVSTNSPEEVKFCGVPSGISMSPIASQYITIDCGYKKIDKYWDGALDYNNYTKIKLFLPFIGFVDLNTDDANGATITVKYNIDLYTGDALAFVHVLKDDYPVKSPESEKEKQAVHINGTMYVHKGNVLSQVPLTGANYQGLYSGIMNLAGDAIMGGVAGAVAGIGAEVMSQKVNVNRSGHLSPNAGELGEYTPYLVIERPIQSKAGFFIDKFGYPSNVYKTFKNLQGLGYLEIEADSLIVDDLTAQGVTNEEINELKSILASGIKYNNP